jgi:hypothetical protein
MNHLFSIRVIMQDNSSFLTALRFYQLLKSFIWIKTLTIFFIVNFSIRYLAYDFAYFFRPGSLICFAKKFAIIEILRLTLDDSLQVVREPFLFICFEIELNLLDLILKFMIFFWNLQEYLLFECLALVIFELRLELDFFY